MFFRRLQLLFVIGLFFFLPFSIQAVHAEDSSENFATDYHITYSVGEDGTTHALLKITLTNLTSDYYASSYKIQLGFENLVNIQASDIGGKLTPTVTKADDGHFLAFTFNKNVVGFDKKQIISISFDTPDIAQRQGKIWEINIPGIANQSDFSTFDVSLKVPKSFGNAAYIKPAQKNSSLTFTKEQLGKSGISLAFGEKQAYRYSLRYHLQNKNLFPIRTEIALPPSTNYQQVSIESLSPKPVTMHEDKDGNWLAIYELSATQKMEVTASGEVVISLVPSKVQESESDLKQYLEEKPYWQISNSKITQLAKELQTPEAIYEYVVKTLNYDFSRVTDNKSRLGAIGVLQRPASAVCLEFTDLFVAIARAAGIPAREVDGYAYTQNPKQRPLSLVQDILHAWPEYYDSTLQTWIMVDPTWGNTTGGVDYFHTLDFDHLTLVKKGLSSTYPIPAGGYKSVEDENKKDVDISFADNVQLPAPVLSLDTQMATTFTAGLPIEGTVTVMNAGPTQNSDDSLLVISDTLSPHKQKVHVGSLLPFEQKAITVSFNKQPFLTNSTHTITMMLAGKTEQKTLHVVPVFLQEWRIIGGIGFAIFTIIIFIIAIKTRRIRLF